MIVPSTCDSWATIRIELSTHRNLESHMLVPFCDVLPNTEIPLETVETEEISGSVSIVGTGLSLSDHSLSTSTGPLFTFRQSTSASHTLPAHTYLLRSGLSNVTSSGKTDIGLVSPLSSQTLSASDMSHVTNHFDGTALLDVNSGTVPSGTTILSILRCTFIVTSATHGGAVFVHVKMLIKSSSRRATFTNAKQQTPLGQSDLMEGTEFMDKCVFSECSAQDAGGAILLGTAKGAVTDSYFDKCVAVRGPAIFAEDAKLTGSNNSIIGCSSVEMGTLFLGAWLETILDTSPEISKFFFRDNLRTRTTTQGRDIFVRELHNFPLTPEKIADCDTSSDYLAVHISNPDTDSASIPQVPKATHIVSSSMTMESSTATFTVTCAHAMTGTMAVLLDGDTLPRLIFVTFSDSITGTGTATVGTGGVLPSGKTYTLRSAVMPGWGLGMYIVSAVARVRDANATTIEVTVGGEETASSLKFGETYEIESVGEGVDSFYVNPGRSFFVPLPPRIDTFSFASGEITTNWTVLTVEGTTATHWEHRRSFWDGLMRMKYGTEYTISSMILSEEGKDDEFILLDSSVFTTPLGPSVSAIGCDFDSSTLNNVVLTVTSSGMSGEEFTVEVSEKQDTSNILSFSMPFSSTSGSKNVTVYKQPGRWNMEKNTNW
ncbi:hypothetical protein BLNAU_23672 [Blattamonas nauphoetae]|uniref:Uncharacterized protein n=1 Tax=Blattamonas nauphoetae TaxID=2049346 RepID=A0ABQ9WQM9_9EUKA|nr:hypothetical protein BLNAU_23672 [Blattamonas nauphoetae]